MDRIKCFVAMAFDRKDTDNLYKEMICSLNSFNLNIKRIDKINHNDDIDDRIIGEINKRDFAIVDLTYARPSVYFEAGFAYGQKKQVIYTCRQDHFTVNQADEFGNLRVHFDLQMKNIIKWNPNNFKQFKIDIKKRVRLVVNEFIIANKHKHKEKENVKIFESLSLTSKIQEIKKIKENILNKNGFKKFRFKHKYYEVEYEYNLTKGRLRIICIFITNKINKNKVEDYCGRYIEHYQSLFGNYFKSKKYPFPDLHIILCSIENMSSKIISNTYTFLKYDFENEFYYEEVHFNDKKNKGNKFRGLLTISSISNIKSEDDFEKQFGTQIIRIKNANLKN